MMYVMSGDIVVAKFDEEFNLEIINADLAPIYLVNRGNVKNWIEGRAVDKTRSNSRSLKKEYGLSRNASNYKSSMKMDAATITDNFWVKADYDPRCYDDIKFKRDDYFRLALCSDINYLGLGGNIRTPELTNIGAQEKGWKLVNGEWWLYKNETLKEVVSEYITYRIGKELGFNVAEYEIVDGGEFIRTKDFTGGKYNLQHIECVMVDHEENGIEVPDDDFGYNYRVLKEMDSGLAEEYLNICILDALCESVDRHTENYGFLTDRSTGNIVGLAPNYDNNMSIFYNTGISEVRNKGYLKLFIGFLEKEGIKIQLPVLEEDKVSSIINEVYSITDFKFDKDMLVKFIMNGYNILKQYSK